MGSEVSQEIAQRIKSYVEWAAGMIWEEVVCNLEAPPELNGQDFVDRVQEVAKSALLNMLQRRRSTKSEPPLNAPHWSKKINAESREFVLFHARHRHDVKKIAETFEIQLSEADEVEIFSDAFRPVHWKCRELKEARRVDEVTTGIKKAQNIYKTFLRRSQELPISRLTSIGVGITLGVLEAMIRPSELKDAKKRLGFNQPNSKEVKRQGFWNEVIAKLVDRVNPLCGGRKTRIPQVSDKALKFVARLLNTCYPDIWPNDHRAIGKRYRDTKKIPSRKS